jgi:hypothetical protein
MNEQALTNTLISLVGLLSVYFLLFWLYRAHRIDSFRQEMFILRDELFDEAAAGLIPFNHPAYRELRVAMNGFIRFGHSLSLSYFVVLWLLSRRSEESNEFADVWQKALSKLDEPTCKRMNNYKFRMSMIAAKHILLLPEVFILLLPVGLLVGVWLLSKLLQVVLKRQMLNLKAIIGRRFDELNNAAWFQGC